MMQEEEDTIMSLSQSFFENDESIAMSEYEYDYDEDEDDICSVHDEDDDDDHDDRDDHLFDCVGQKKKGRGKEDDILLEYQRRGANGEIIVVVDATTLTPLMNSEVRSMAETLNISPSAALVALRKFHWEKQRLLDSYFADKDKCTSKAGVFHRCSSERINTRQGHTGPEKNLCAICFDDDLPSDKMHSMPCGHTFCVECWTGHVSAKLDDGPSCVESTCPDLKCTELITEEEVRKFAPSRLPKFQSYQLRSFVEWKRNTRWCPGPDCDKIVTIPTTQDMSESGIEIHCQKCDTSFCLACGDEPHKPLCCKDLKYWRENFSAEASENWILTNTKACPKCRVRIEKNQGCNHMTCKQCRHEFCWICNGDWRTHEQCNRFEEDGKSGKERELARNLHYFKRINIHSDAQKFAAKQLGIVKSKLLEAGFTPKNNESLAAIENMKESVIKANEQLVKCRRTLKHTYIYAYFHLQKSTSEDEEFSGDINNVQTEQFEFQQEMLEKFTEELSDMTEKPISTIEKLQLVNKTEAVNKFMASIISYVTSQDTQLVP